MKKPPVAVSIARSAEKKKASEIVFAVRALPDSKKV
jgi:hypothetical protein